MKEIISIHIGQAGIQSGNSCWELFCLEHEINQNLQIKQQKEQYSDQSVLFKEASSEKYYARAVYIDSEPNVIDEVKKSSIQPIFSSKQLISGKQDCSNNFARGYKNESLLFNQSCNEIRRQAEACSNCQGFQLCLSSSGGTGSGLGSRIIQYLDDEFKKKERLIFCIYPSPNLSSPLEPYNTILLTNNLIDHESLCVMVDNEQLYTICEQQLEMEQPSFLNINRIIAQQLSSLTGQMRFNGTSNNNTLKDLSTNLLVYPRLHFLITGFAPYISKDQNYIKKYSVNDITKNVFNIKNLLLSCNPTHGKYIACSLQYRGYISPAEIYESIFKVKQTIQFCDFSPMGFKIGICNKKQQIIDQGQSIRSVSMLSNNTSIAEVFAKLDHKFDLLFSKRCFLQWFLSEGLEEMNFQEARDNVSYLENDYDFSHYYDQFAEGYGNEEEF